MKNHEEIVMEAMLANGDLPGHEFHGNQYSGGGSYDKLASNAYQKSHEAFNASAERRAPGKDTVGTHKTAQKAHEEAGLAHHAAAEAATNPEDKKYHEQMAGRHEARAGEHLREAARIYAKG